METSAKDVISFWKEIPLELSCINSMKCHMKPESVFPVTFPGQKPRVNIIFFCCDSLKRVYNYADIIVSRTYVLLT